MFLRPFWKRSPRRQTSLGAKPAPRRLKKPRILKKLDSALCFFFLFLAGFYKAFLSGSLGMGGCCRFYPSCGDYAIEAYKSLPFLKATIAVARRLVRCRPFGPADPGSWKTSRGGAAAARRGR